MAIRLTESKLRQIVREEVKNLKASRSRKPLRESVGLRCDTSYEIFPDVDSLRVGQDVTSVFASDYEAPNRATIVNPVGPGGGNPEVNYEFDDMQHARAWWAENMCGGVDFYDDEEFMLAVDAYNSEM